MKSKILIFFCLFCVFISCKNANKKQDKLKDIAKIEVIEKEFNFGNATLNDTIVHIFKVKNISNQILKIKKLAPSCRCTTSKDIDSIANKNEYVEFKIQYIPKKDDLGKISNSLVVEMNTEPPFTIFRLTGNIY
ncbi:MAG: DUF1573 domain-containing protein [Polaribacter sp.]